jgi:hypothetical protein
VGRRSIGDYVKFAVGEDAEEGKEVAINDGSDTMKVKFEKRNIERKGYESVTELYIIFVLSFHVAVNIYIQN